MTDEEKNRLIELLIRSFNRAFGSEGVYFLGDGDAIELLMLLIKYDSDDDNNRRYTNQLKLLLEL